MSLQLEISVLGHFATNMEDREPPGNQVAASFPPPLSSQKNYMVNLKQKGERTDFKWQEALETSKLIHSDIFPAAVPHPKTNPNSSHLGEEKYSISPGGGGYLI